MARRLDYSCKLSFTSRKHASASHLRDVYMYCLKLFLQKKLYLRLYLTQLVHSNDEMLFLYLNNCESEFLWRAADIKLFFTSKKCSVSARVGKSLARCLLSKAFLVETIVSLVLFGTNRSFKR